MIRFKDEPAQEDEQIQEIDASPKVRSPWRRFFARSLDVVLYGILLMIIQVFVFNINVLARSAGGNFLDAIIAYFLMVVIEPVLLAVFGTTLGKWIMGMRITDKAGRKLTYAEGLTRTFTVFGQGFGFNIPIYSLVRLWKSYRVCADGEMLEWEFDSTLHMKDDKKWRFAALLTTYVALFAMVLMLNAQATMPKHRGDITVAEFSENYNRLADYYAFNHPRSLDALGEWVIQERDGPLISLSGEFEPPVFKFIQDNGVMTGMYFTMERINSRSWTPSYKDEIMLSVLAFVRAQDEDGPFKNEVINFMKVIQEDPFAGFQVIIHGVTIQCEYTYSGYDHATSFGYLIPQNNGDSDNYYLVEFKMFK